MNRGHRRVIGGISQIEPDISLTRGRFLKLAALGPPSAGIGLSRRADAAERLVRP